jgi:hypothetical protein
MTVAQLLASGDGISAFEPGFKFDEAVQHIGEVQLEAIRRGGPSSAGRMLRESELRQFSREGWMPIEPDSRRLHVTPTGIYYRLTMVSVGYFHAGSFLLPDGTVGHFAGRQFTPLYCLGCGRADLRMGEDINCQTINRVPRKVLNLVPSDPRYAEIHRKLRIDYRNKQGELKRRSAEAAIRNKVAVEAEAAALSARYRAANEEREAQAALEASRSPLERSLRSAAYQVKGIVIFLLLIMLFAIAGRGQ